jgi:hypothetical protein
MVLLPEPLERRRVYMGVDLGRLNIAVTEQLLDGAQIRPILKQMGRETVTKGMDTHLQARQSRVLIETLADRLTGEALPPATQKERLAGFGSTEEVGPNLLQIICQRRLSNLADRNEPHLVALSDDSKLSVLVVLDIDRRRFADPQSARVDDFEKGLIPDAKIVGGVDDRKEVFNFIIGSHTRKRLILLGSPNERKRVVLANLPKLEKREKGTKGAERFGDASRSERASLTGRDDKRFDIPNVHDFRIFKRFKQEAYLIKIDLDRAFAEPFLKSEVVFILL